jgi:hypothetical protein
MKMTIPMGLTLLSMSGAVLAWQPVVYPIRSQNAWQQNTDAATCYGTARRQSGVDMTREAQSPTRPKLASGAASIGSGAQVSARRRWQRLAYRLLAARAPQRGKPVNRCRKPTRAGCLS